MKLSICIIFHNQLNYINRILNSIYSQNLPFEYEILLGDDFSTDGTWEKLNKISKANKNIHCFQINSSNFNPDDTIDRSGINRWNVYKHITGQYFSFIDADDYYIDNERFVEQISLLDANPDCAVCAANTALYRDTTPPSFINLMTPAENYSTGEKFLQKDFLKMFFHNSSCVIRKPDQDYSRLYSPFIFDDYTLTLMHLNTGKLIYLNKPVFAYIQQENSIYSRYTKYERYLRSICRTPKSIYAFPKYSSSFKAYFSDTTYYLITTKDGKCVTNDCINLAGKTIPKTLLIINSTNFFARLKKNILKLCYIIVRILNKLHRGDYNFTKSLIYDFLLKSN